MSGNFELSTPSQTPVVDLKNLLKESYELAQSGRTRDALKVLEQAERNLQKDSFPDEFDRELELGRICNNKGITFKNMKAWDRSAACYEEAITHFQKSKKEPVRERIGVEINLAVLRARQCDRKRALDGFERAEKLAGIFRGREYEDIMTKILTNRAQLHLEFNEIEKARELLDRVAAFDKSKDKAGRKERGARVSAQLGQLVARLAENTESQYAKEYSQQAIKLFQEAEQYYTELGMWRDSLVLMLNRSEALMNIGCIEETAKTLEKVLFEARERCEYSLYSSATLKLLDVAIAKKERELIEKRLEDAVSASKELPEAARKDFLENLESRLRLGGWDEYVCKVKQYRNGEGNSLS